MVAANDGLDVSKHVPAARIGANDRIHVNTLSIAPPLLSRWLSTDTRRSDDGSLLHTPSGRNHLIEGVGVPGGGNCEGPVGGLPDKPCSFTHKIDAVFGRLDKADRS
jgi:hypothetical protein